MKKISADFNMSESTFQRRLKEEGVSFQTIKAEERINRAKELLLYSKDNLDSIAEQLAFSNSSNFSKSFKAAVGMSPRDFRNNQ